MEHYKATLMDEAAVNRAVKRIAHEIVERLLNEAPESVLDQEQERDMLDYLASIEANA